MISFTQINVMKLALAGLIEGSIYFIK